MIDLLYDHNLLIAVEFDSYGKKISLAIYRILSEFIFFDNQSNQIEMKIDELSYYNIQNIKRSIMNFLFGE